MTTADTLRTDLMRAVTGAANDIVEDCQRQGLSTEVAIAVATTVVGMLTDKLPAEKRAPFLRNYAANLLRTPHLDA